MFYFASSPKHSHWLYLWTWGMQMLHLCTRKDLVLISKIVDQYNWLVKWWNYLRDCFWLTVWNSFVKCCNKLWPARISINGSCISQMLLWLNTRSTSFVFSWIWIWLIWSLQKHSIKYPANAFSWNWKMLVFMARLFVGYNRGIIIQRFPKISRILSFLRP